MLATAGKVPKAHRHQQTSCSESVSVEPFEVLLAVRTLYADELRPVGRIVRKRISEVIAARHFGYDLSILATTLGSPSDDSSFDLDSGRLRQICESCDGLRVTPERGGDWCVTMSGWSPRFVDIYSCYDSYSPELWKAFAAYCEGPEAETMSLPGGRYTCARALMARGLPFLAGFSLGRICHVVQLALTEKKILGYFSQSVVPYARSQSMRKEQCAKTQQPCSKGAPLTLADWDTARACLHEIINSSEGGEVPLSNVKRLFRSRYHLELSETWFGYAKVSDLLQDVRFSDICVVQLHGRGYIVTQPPLGTLPLQNAAVTDFRGVPESRHLPILLGSITVGHASPNRKFINLAEQVPSSASNVLPPMAERIGGMLVEASIPRPNQASGDADNALRDEVDGRELWRRRPMFCSEQALAIAVSRHDSQPTPRLLSPTCQELRWHASRRCVVQNTFLELPETPKQIGSMRRVQSAPPRFSCSVPECVGIKEIDECVSRCVGIPDLCSASHDCGGILDWCASVPQRFESRRSCNVSTAFNSPAGDHTISTASSISWACSPSWEEQGKRTSLQSHLEAYDQTQDQCGQHAQLDVEHSESFETGLAKQKKAMRTPGRVDNHRRTRFCDSPGLEEDLMQESQAMSPPLLTPSRLTPGKLKERGVLVRNTFLHIMVPATPSRCTSRSNSVPRNMGSVSAHQ